jgi:hypothetical protein
LWFFAAGKSVAPTISRRNTFCPPVLETSVPPHLRTAGYS